MVNLTILECHIVDKILTKISLKFHPFFRGGGGNLRWFPYLDPLARNWNKWLQSEIFRSSWSVKCIVGFFLPRRSRLWQETQHFLNTVRARSIGGNIQDIFTYMAIQTYPIITSQKICETLKYVHPIKSCPLNFEIVRDAKRDWTVLDEVKHSIIQCRVCFSKSMVTISTLSQTSVTTLVALNCYLFW